ncbi:hypothetical protein CY34DRAFT_35311, partial [Suillus luteus UH-Slu-Lm8-n1]
RIITYSQDGSFRVWDLKTGKQVGEKWEDEDYGVETIALSPDGKKVASGSFNGAVKLWNINTGKVIKTWTGHSKEVRAVSWSPDGGRVVSGSYDGTFRVWNVESGKTILGPIEVGEDVRAICYSPDAKMIATTGGMVRIWGADSGESLKSFEVHSAPVLLSPNNRILATTSLFERTVQLWNLEINQPIGTPLHCQHRVDSATFSADGKFLVASCLDDHIYTWD